MISILKRLHYISHAQVQHKIDAMEDPNIMLGQVVRDLSEHIRSTKVQLVKAMSCQKQFKCQFDQHMNNSNIYYSKAEKALQENQEEVARKAMNMSLEQKKIVLELKPALERADNSIENIKSHLLDLENKREIARRHHRLLSLRHKLAIAEISSNQFIEDQIQDLDADELLLRMQNKVYQTEAVSESMVEISTTKLTVEKDISVFEDEQQVDRELEKLKAKLQGNNELQK